MKKMLLFAVALLLALCLPTLAEERSRTYRSGDYEYQLNADGSAMITYYNGSDEELVIPDQLDGIPVTSIGDEAFYADRLISVTIPQGVTSIGEKAFWYCRYLSVVSIPKDVASIGYAAFAYCDSLTEFVVSAENTTYASIDGVLFNKKENTIVCYPGGKEDAEYAIPDGTVSIAALTFSSNSITGGALTSISIPQSVTYIEVEAFSYWRSLTEIKVDEENTAYASIDGVLFNKQEDEIICYPRKKREVESEYIIPQGVKSIGDSAFYDCDGLYDIMIPEGATSIGENAFSNCRISNISIPQSVVYIGEGAFTYCSNLKEFQVSEDSPMFATIDGILFNKQERALVCYPRGRKETELFPFKIGRFTGAMTLRA